MTDHADTHHDGRGEAGAAGHWWEVRNLQLAALSGVLLAPGLAAGWLSLAPIDTVAFAAALVLGGLTFILGRLGFIAPNGVTAKVTAAAAA